MYYIILVYRIIATDIYALSTFLNIRVFMYMVVVLYCIVALVAVKDLRRTAYL